MSYQPSLKKKLSSFFKKKKTDESTGTSTPRISSSSLHTIGSDSTEPSEITLVSSKIKSSLKNEQPQLISDLSLNNSNNNSAKQTSKYINEPCDPSKTIPQYRSEIEEKIRNSKKPIETKENFILYEGKQYVWLNKEECDNWRGEKPLSEYEYPTVFNYENAKVVNLEHDKCIARKKTYKIKYLKPPTQEIPPPIIIEQEPDYYESKLPPPLILRQRAPSQSEKETLTIREMPPNQPEQLSNKLINVGGKQLPTPPRRVIIEQMAPEPARNSEVTVERWLPYEQPKRSIILKEKPLPPCIEVPINTIYKWKPQCVDEETYFEDLGEEQTDPNEYKEKHGSTLISTSALPRELLDNKEDKLKTSAKDQDYLIKESDKEMYRKFYEGLSEERRKLLSEIFKDNSDYNRI